MRFIVVCGLVAAAFGATADVDRAPADAALAASRHSGSMTGRCGTWAVPARIRAKAVCLRDNQRCARRLSTQYRRYGFACQSGTLLTRWEFLRRRSLTDRTIAPGEACPVTTETGRVGLQPGLGPGPAYPIGTHTLITMRLPPPVGWGTEWSGTKRLWLLDTRYVGRALVRGRQLDGPNQVRFVLGRPAFTVNNRLNPVRELKLDQARDNPSQTRLRAPGCYAYQVDGRTFSYLIVFEARLAEGK
jgi:hypothetical protein